ncbi:hypothetical protein AVL62_08600 [Serinicoccus chungangensis]|uniref:DUF5926 domain-containing protein n=1 Tax=Serinicoccus chungangensis TaxID=767452 RepID=A0A0W8I2L6_9MICO|nr:DUF5926 family protein [Serinicoccus chungangensis]KUG51977.1 hypothetical protein AVL62_08600 [Serinicoccus chungangensis]
MGKASRKKRQAGGTQAQGSARPAPFVSRPFEGLADESEWVAMREILPAASAPVTLAVPEGTTVSGREVPAGEHQVTLVTVLPAAMPAIHRENGEVLVALQSRTSSGDASRDIVAAALTALAAEPGTSVNSVRPATTDTPRLQDVLVEGQQLAVEVHDDFGFWLGEDASEEMTAALEQMNESAVPMARVEGVPTAFWCHMSGRSYIRWILDEDEDTALQALARLQAAHEHTLGEGTDLIGAFRACGVLVPVLEVPAGTGAEDHAEALTALQERYAAALGQDAPLTEPERRARNALVSRQVTLR